MLEMMAREKAKLSSVRAQLRDTFGDEVGEKEKAKIYFSVKEVPRWKRFKGRTCRSQWPEMRSRWCKSCRWDRGCLYNI